MSGDPDRAPAPGSFAGPLDLDIRAALVPGDPIAPGRASDYGARRPAAWVDCAGTLDAAIWGAELAQGEGRERIHVVEPTGPIKDDPNLTNRRVPGSPSLSFRTRDPLRGVGEVGTWEPHPPERLREMREHLERLMAQGVEAID